MIKITIVQTDTKWNKCTTWLSDDCSVIYRPHSRLDSGLRHPTPWTDTKQVTEDFRCTVWKHAACTTCKHYVTFCSGGMFHPKRDGLWLRAEETRQRQDSDRRIDGYRMRERRGASILPSTMTWQRSHNTAATWARGHSASPTPFHTLPRCLSHARILFLGLLINI